MLTLSAPICVADIHPKTAVLRQNGPHRIEHVGKCGDKIGRVLLKPDLAFDLIIALAVERRRRDNAVCFDPSISEQLQTVAHIHIQDERRIV